MIGFDVRQDLVQLARGNVAFDPFIEQMCVKFLESPAQAVEIVRRQL